MLRRIERTRRTTPPITVIWLAAILFIAVIVVFVLVLFLPGLQEAFVSNA
jgi:hypothetical protein